MLFVIVLHSAGRDQTLGGGLGSLERNDVQEKQERTLGSTVCTCTGRGCTRRYASSLSASIAVIELSKRRLCLDSKGMKATDSSEHRVDNCRYAHYTTTPGIAMAWSRPHHTTAQSDRMRRACLGVSAPLHCLTARHLHAFPKRRAQRRFLFQRSTGFL